MEITAELFILSLLAIGGLVGGVLIYMIRTLEMVRKRGHAIREIASNAQHSLDLYKMEQLDDRQDLDFRLQRVEGLLKELIDRHK